MSEIVNRVANSALEVFDLEDYYTEGQRVTLDISQWLSGGFILKEKDFRESLENTNWAVYQHKLVAVYCSTDAIVPAWAFMLVASYVAKEAKFVMHGSLHELEMALYHIALEKIDFSTYKDKPTIVKGCSKKVIPQQVYSLALQKLQPIAKSIMYGEACSAVPIYKNSKK